MLIYFLFDRCFIIVGCIGRRVIGEGIRIIIIGLLCWDIIWLDVWDIWLKVWLVYVLVWGFGFDFK